MFLLSCEKFTEQREKRKRRNKRFCLGSLSHSLTCSFSLLIPAILASQVLGKEIQRPGPGSYRCWLMVTFTGEVHKGVSGVGICIELVRLVMAC
jgi:hypothetical protein